jgi:hypothetical protein
MVEPSRPAPRKRLLNCVRIGLPFVGRNEELSSSRSYPAGDTCRRTPSGTAFGMGGYYCAHSEVVIKACRMAGRI